MSQQRCVGDSKIHNSFFFFLTFCIPKKTAARAASSSYKNMREKYMQQISHDRTLIPLSTAVLVMARLFDCGMKRKESDDSSDLSCDTERLVMKAQTPPETNKCIISTDRN